MSQYAPSSHGTRQPHTSQANGFAKPVRSPTWGSRNQSYENESMHLSADHGDELHRKSSGDMNAISNDPNSVLDHYKNNKSRTAASVKGKPKKKNSKGGPADPNWDKIEHDENNWIHRDKLKEIETKELEAAGFRVGRASGTNSRSQSATRKPRDRRASSAAGQNANGDEREGRRVVSPIPAEDEDAIAQDGTWSPTTFEELAAGGYSNASRTNNHSGRPSTSRIPLPKTSGIPVPASLAERDAPLSRSRAGSDNWSGDAIATNGARVRSGSIASQFLLDEPEDERRTTPPYGHARKLSANSGSPPKSPQKSPMKAKPPNKAPVSGARKTSAKTQPKGSRKASGTTPPKRPGTSGGTVSRPTTSHRPEGEAPWLATMYKPDPRLPPDQQIIPTHAKRMQQEQWENEGRVGSMYDKDFRLLNTDETDGKRLSQIDPIALEKERENEKARENGTWPLPSPEKTSPLQQHSSENLDTNASKTQGNEQPGYKLTPTIPQGPRVPSPKLAPPIAPPGELPLQPKTTRLPEPVEEEKPKKSLCCIVM
jgi:hypothetical protein